MSIKQIICRIIGHKAPNVITGFSSIGGMAIGRCPRCEMPVVSNNLRGSQQVVEKCNQVEDR